MAAILLVDDSASVRRTVKIALTGEGHNVMEAADGAEGLAKAAAGRFDLVITDLNMPVMDGLTMIRQLRQKSAQAGLPVLFLTTESDAGVKAQAKAAGATGWLTKPFTRPRRTGSRYSASNRRNFWSGSSRGCSIWSTSRAMRCWWPRCSGRCIR